MSEPEDIPNYLTGYFIGIGFRLEHIRSLTVSQLDVAHVLSRTVDGK
jgi:hypothetical protein